MADGALRCFASLADRFTRRGTDPAPLAKHGLVEDLISRLETTAPPGGPGGTPGNINGNASRVSGVDGYVIVADES